MVCPCWKQFHQNKPEILRIVLPVLQSGWITDHVLLDPSEVGEARRSSYQCDLRVMHLIVIITLLPSELLRAVSVTDS